MTPDTIKQFQPPHSEIRQKNGHYYVYAVQGYYDKATGKSKSRSLGCIGQIYENIGYVPNKKKDPPTEAISREYGATRIIMQTSEDVLELLRGCFPSDFMRIYIMAVLKLLCNIAMRDMDIAYEKSAISRLLPEVHLSKNTVHTFIERLSLNRAGMLKFMRTYHRFHDDSIIFDGSSFISQSHCNPFVEQGYSPGHRGMKQIRLLYAFNKSTRMPIYFNIVPGNIPDVAVFETAMEEMEAKNCVIIFDNGFYSEKNIELVMGMDFIVPLKRNTKEVDKNWKHFMALEKVKDQRFTYNGRFVNFTVFPSKKFAGCKICVYYDNERHFYLLENLFKRLNSGSEELTQQQLDEKASTLGVTMLLTNLQTSPQDIYQDYKSRWEIEEMFDSMKNTLNFEMNYEEKFAVQEGWAFIEFVALMLFYKIDALLIEKKLIKDMNVKSLLFRAASLTQSKVGDKWIVCNATEKMKKLFTMLDISLQPIP